MSAADTPRREPTARLAAARWVPLGLVVLGGTCGAAAREGVVLTVPDVAGAPLAILVVNVVGAFLLGCLTEAALRRAPGEPRAVRLRLLLGTGFCGGFTTYSTLATGIAVMVDQAQIGTALTYAAVTLLVGGGATFAGIVVAARWSDRPRRGVRGAGA